MKKALFSLLVLSIILMATSTLSAKDADAFNSTLNADAFNFVDGVTSATTMSCPNSCLNCHDSQPMAVTWKDKGTFKNIPLHAPGNCNDCH